MMKILTDKERLILILGPDAVRDFVPRDGDEMAKEFFLRLLRMDDWKYRAFHAEEGGKVIGLGGIVKIWDGVGIGGLAFSSEAMTSGNNETSRWLHRSILVEMTSIIQELGLHRVETTVACDYPDRCRWIEHIGFRDEGLMRKYGPDGKDHYRYAWVN